MILLASYFLAGVLGLLVLDYADQLSLAGMANVAWAAFMRRRRYVGRHWADGLSTMQLVDELRAARAALTEPTQSLFLPDVDEPAPVSPPYAHSLGAGRYAHLRQDELDASVARDLRRLGTHAPVNLAALRLRTSTMPVVEEHDDEWASVG